MKREVPNEPNGDQCERNERLADVDGYPAYACWYPQMGGYHGKAVCVVTGGEDECFDVFVWHDGTFPFGDGNPSRVHHCSPSQFISFGEAVLTFQRKHPPENDE